MIDYTFKKPTIISDKQIIDLYQSVDWLAHVQQPQNTITALKNSAVLWAMDNEQLVGICRGITDQRTILYIQDILVNPKYQRQHVGTNLVQKFLKHFENIGQTVLITDPDESTLKFYQSLKFIEVTPAKYGRAFVMDRRFG